MVSVLTNIMTAIAATSQMMLIFFGAFFVVYVLARALLPLERGLSKYVWEHSGSLKPLSTKGSFKEFSQRHHT